METRTLSSPNNSQESETLIQASAFVGYVSSPLPPPEHLARYKEIYADAPKIIFEHMQAEQKHRHGLEIAYQRLQARGQSMAFVFACVALGVAVLSAYLGYENAAMVIAGATLMGVVAAFLKIKTAESPKP